MDTLTIIAIATGLSIDAFVVAVSGGSTIRRLKLAQALKIAVAFGLFQAIMPVIGWAAGVTFGSYVQNYSHWIAFGLLAYIGGRMIFNSLSGKPKDEEFDIRKIATLLMLAIAISIDALAVGLSFAMLNSEIFRIIIIIGIITFLFSLIGVYIGNRLGGFFEKKLEVIGGVILILIGIKILLEGSCLFG